MENKGITAEAKFVYDATVMGLTVNIPIDDKNPYDFVTELNGTLNRVQVKSARKEKNGSYKVTTSRGYKKKVLYTKEDIDFFAINLEDWDGWMIIPVLAIDKITTTIRLTDKRYVGVYMDRWDLLS